LDKDPKDRRGKPYPGKRRSRQRKQLVRRPDVEAGVVRSEQKEGKLG
jgi:hypothetical protein